MERSWASLAILCSFSCCCALSVILSFSFSLFLTSLYFLFWFEINGKFGKVSVNFATCKYIYQLLCTWKAKKKKNQKISNVYTAYLLAYQLTMLWFLWDLRYKYVVLSRGPSDFVKRTTTILSANWLKRFKNNRNSLCDNTHKT